MATHRYDKVLDRELTTLAEEDEFRRSTEEVLMKQWEKNYEKEALVKQKRAAANALIFNTKFAVSASLLSFTKLTLPLTVSTTSPAFLLIKEISNSENDTLDIKDPQEQKEEALNLEPRTMVARAGPLAI